jgi:hypothetical protein
VREAAGPLLATALRTTGVLGAEPEGEPEASVVPEASEEPEAPGASSTALDDPAPSPA